MENLLSKRKTNSIASRLASEVFCKKPWVHTRLHFGITEFKNCLNFMDSRDHTLLLQKFAALNRRLDSIRGELTTETVQELPALPW